MTEKRHFRDYFSSSKGFLKVHMIIILFTLIFIIASCIISYNILISKNAEALNSYSEETYEYLDEIADSAIIEGVGIDFSALPNDVKFEYSNFTGNTTFKYWLNNNEDMKFAPSASMTLTLSDNFEIISRKPNYQSKEVYVKDVKFLIILTCISIGIVSGALIFVIMEIPIYIYACVLEKKEKKSIS